MEKIIFLLLIHSLFQANSFAESEIPILDNNQNTVFYPYERIVENQYSIKIKHKNNSQDNNFDHFWYAIPRNTSTQKILSIPKISPRPTNIYTDIHGNKIAYWNFANTHELNLTISYKLKVNNIINKIDPNNLSAYDSNSDEYKLYTQSNRIETITDKIIEIATNIKDNSINPDNPYLLAQDVFNWIMYHMAYELVPNLNRDRGTKHILANPHTYKNLTYYKGDCGSYSFMYNTILRALGIPARLIVGGWSFSKNQYHVWSEILIPEYGWIPVDTSVADVFIYDEGEELNKLGRKSFNIFPQIKDHNYFFGNIDPYRFVTSIGSDIKLNPKPNWNFSEYNQSWFYDNGSAGVIQLGIFNTHLDVSIDQSFRVIDKL